MGYKRKLRWVIFLNTVYIQHLNDVFLSLIMQYGTICQLHCIVMM